MNSKKKVFKDGDVLTAEDMNRFTEKNETESKKPKKGIFEAFSEHRNAILALLLVIVAGIFGLFSGSLNFIVTGIFQNLTSAHSNPLASTSVSNFTIRDFGKDVYLYEYFNQLDARYAIFISKALCRTRTGDYASSVPVGCTSNDFEYTLTTYLRYPKGETEAELPPLLISGTDVSDSLADPSTGHCVTEGECILLVQSPDRIIDPNGQFEIQLVKYLQTPEEQYAIFNITFFSK